MPAEYYPILALFVIAGGLTAAFLLGAFLLGPYRPTAIKGEPFECGNPSAGTGRKRFSVRFYLVALLFLVFDVEVAFLFPWAAVFGELGWFGFVEMLIFLAVLALGLWYVWVKGALDWNSGAPDRVLAEKGRAKDES